MREKSQMAVIYEQQSWKGKIVQERDVKQGHGRPRRQHLVSILGGQCSSHRVEIAAKLEGKESVQSRH